MYMYNLTCSRKTLLDWITAHFTACLYALCSKLIDFYFVQCYLYMGTSLYKYLLIALYIWSTMDIVQKPH